MKQSVFHGMSKGFERCSNGLPYETRNTRPTGNDPNKSGLSSPEKVFSYPSQHAPIKIELREMVFENQFDSKLHLQQLPPFWPALLCGQTHAVPKWNTGRARRVPRGLRGWTITWRPLPTTGAGGAGTRKATTGSTNLLYFLAKVGDQIDFGPCFQPCNDLQIEISGVLVVARYFGYYSQQLEEETKMNQRFMEKLEEVQEMQRRQQELWELGEICAGGVRSGSPGAKQTGLMCQPVNCSSIDEKFGEDARTSKVQERRNAQEDIWAMNNNLVALVIQGMKSYTIYTAIPGPSKVSIHHPLGFNWHPERKVLVCFLIAIMRIRIKQPVFVGE